jgi:uncharacterized membrane protein YccC
VSIAGIVVAAAGAFLIWFRARMVARERRAASSVAADSSSKLTEGKR